MKGTGPPVSVQHRLLQTAANRPVGYMEYLRETDLSTCLLKDNLQPGVWIAAQAATNTLIRVSILAPPCVEETTTSATTTTAPNTRPSQIFIEKKLAHPSSGAIKGILQIRAETEPNSSPALSGSVQLTKSSSLFASISTMGIGWLGAHYDRTFRIDSVIPQDSSLLAPLASSKHDIYANDPFQTAAQVKPYEGLDTMSRNTVNCKLGTWMPISLRDPFQRKRVDCTIAATDSQCLHGYAAVNMLGATAAVHGTVDPSLQTLPVLRSYFSANLNDVDRPPLQITLERLENMAAISLCQVLAFDRWQLNPADDRAPKVRNTVAWTVRMENILGGASSASTTAAAAAAAEDSGAHGSTNSNNNSQNRISLGAAWQINRGLAVKAVLLPQEQCLTAAVLLKRWKQPRLTCSVLGRVDPRRGWQFLGVGVELETGQRASHPDAYYYNHHPSQATIVVEDGGGGDDDDSGGDASVPQTRAALPSELKERGA